LLKALADLRKRPPKRVRLGIAQDAVNRVVRSLTGEPGVLSVTPAGSWRRRRETIADIDVLVETSDPHTVIRHVEGLPWVERASGGTTRTTLHMMHGPQVDLMTMPVGAAGTYLVHFTGSAEHNVRLRGIARDKGWSLSEHGFTSLTDANEKRTFATEQEVYEFLGLPFIKFAALTGGAGDDVYVSARLALDAALMKDLRAGIEKKLIFYVDLFRHWSSWPDEFIMGKKIERDVGCDNLKGEYTIVSRERGWTEKTRYASCNELINNALILKNIKLSGLRGLTKGRYYIRVTAESKLMNLPPLLGQMFFFIKDKEFSVHTDSAIVNLGDRP
ncbi:MAG: DUF4390 domain-containing protein, partial [Nitrospiraceae bacterium]|nr:DUF4390 domain-containing protein [Nitrospiraceae bacterium]